MDYEVHPDARVELMDAAEWYAERNPDAAARFTSRVGDVIRLVSTSPMQFPRLEGEVRAGLVPGFPYQVLFRVEGNIVRIVAVAHAKRDPGYWRERL